MSHSEDSLNFVDMSNMSFSVTGIFLGDAVVFERGWSVCSPEEDLEVALEHIAELNRFFGHVESVQPCVIGEGDPRI